MFKLRSHRREDGGYDLSYGKGSKKLTAVCQQSDGYWHLTEGFGAGISTPAVKYGAVKEEWERRAVASYGGSGAVEEQTTCPPAQPSGGPPRLSPPPAGPPKLGPPKLVQQQYDGPTCPACQRPITGFHNGLPPCRCNFPNTDQYEADIFDPRMYQQGPGGKGHVLTPTGALDQVFHWMLRSKDYVTTDGKLDPVWADVQEVLSRTVKYPEYRIERFT